MKKDQPKVPTRRYERKVTVTEETTGVKPTPYPTWKRYLLSSLDTFGVVFGAAMYKNIDVLSSATDWESLKVVVFSATWGATIAGLVAVWKAIREAASKPRV